MIDLISKENKKTSIRRMRGYTVYLDGVVLPITPSKISTKIKSKNKVLNLINEGEVNILKEPSLHEISFDISLPYIKYPYAIYPDGFKTVGYYLDILENLMWSKRPFQFLCSRVSPSGNLLFDNNMKVSLQEYKIDEDASNGQELKVSIVLKKYKEYGTCKIDIKEDKKSNIKIATIKKQRPKGKTPKRKKYKVKKNDTLWNIAKKVLGDGHRYKEIYELNKDKIDRPNLIYPGQILILPV